MAKEIKIQYIKSSNPELYNQVVAGKLSLQDAYNEAKRLQLGLAEFRGKNTKKKEFSVDFKRLIALHNPTVDELVEEIKKAFPFTWKEFIKKPE